jgi:hypothetical protein
MLIALRAEFGQDEANHGTERYRVGDDGVVLVPRTVAIYLVNNAGFCAARRPDPEQAKPIALELQPPFLVRVHHPRALVCSYGGCEYRADQKGEFLVPATAVADLTGHGFVPIGPADGLGESSSALVLAPPTDEEPKTVAVKAIDGNGYGPRGST